MSDKERLLKISKKLVFEAGLNTIKAEEVRFLFSHITKLEHEIAELAEENQNLNEHIETLNQIIGMYEERDEQEGLEND